MQLSFGMIFSIILIIAFIALAVWGIGKFLNMQKDIQIKNFKRDLQIDVNRLYHAPQGLENYNYILPKKIVAVCFRSDDSGNKMELKEEGKPFPQKHEIEYLDSEEGIFEASPPCIPVENGKVKIKLEKKYKETLVTITATE